MWENYIFMWLEVDVNMEANEFFKQKAVALTVTEYVLEIVIYLQ